MAAALALTVRGGGTPVVLLWRGGAHQHSIALPATPAARRVAAAMTARGVPAAGRGRLVLATMPAAPPSAMRAVERVSAAARGPLVLSISGPRARPLDDLLADAGGVLYAGDEAGVLARLVLGELADAGIQGEVATPLPGVAAALARAGLAAPASLRRRLAPRARAERSGAPGAARRTARARGGCGGPGVVRRGAQRPRGSSAGGRPRSTRRGARVARRSAARARSSRRGDGACGVPGVRTRCRPAHGRAQRRAPHDGHVRRRGAPGPCARRRARPHQDPGWGDGRRSGRRGGGDQRGSRRDRRRDIRRAACGTAGQADAPGRRAGLRSSGGCSEARRPEADGRERLSHRRRAGIAVRRPPGSEMGRAAGSLTAQARHRARPGPGGRVSVARRARRRVRLRSPVLVGAMALRVRPQPGKRLGRLRRGGGRSSRVRARPLPRGTADVVATLGRRLCAARRAARAGVGLRSGFAIARRGARHRPVHAGDGARLRAARSAGRRVVDRRAGAPDARSASPVRIGAAGARRLQRRGRSRVLVLVRSTDPRDPGLCASGSLRSPQERARPPAAVAHRSGWSGDTLLAPRQGSA